MLSKGLFKTGTKLIQSKKLFGVTRACFGSMDYDMNSIKQGFLISLKNEAGALSKVLEIFASNDVNLTHIESKLLNKQPDGTQNAIFSVDLENSYKTDAVINQIKNFANVVEKTEVPVVPWFPTKINDLDQMGGVLQERDDEGGRDHPLFKDHTYKKRRDEIAAISRNTKITDPIPFMEYLPSENATWKTIYEKLIPMHKEHMCKQYLECFEKLRKNCGLNENTMPQLREFLNSLAFGVFPCTQYIRHHENPLYTPEPDIVHELIGHVPMFVDKDFCDMSQTIGLLSLGASEEDIVKLGALYWYTVEFGACKEGDTVKGYGSGIASSIGEMQHFSSGKAKFQDLDPFRNLPLDYPVQTVQPIYMVAKSFLDAQFQLIEFGEYLKRPFNTWYNYETKTIEADRKVRTRKKQEAPPGF